MCRQRYDLPHPPEDITVTVTIREEPHNLRGRSRYRVITGKTVSSTPELIKGEVLTRWRYINPLLLPLTFTTCGK